MQIFLDAGFYVGNATKIFQENGTINESWKVYAFEPYKRDDQDKLLEARLPIKVEIINKAVWIKDGQVDFVVRQREDSHHLNFDSPAEGDELTKVPTIDFSKFVSELPESYIICSMDIEGAEFKILEKMLRDNTIDKINILDIEFHHRLLHDYTQKDAEKLIKQIRKRGVKVKLKVPLI